MHRSQADDLPPPKDTDTWHCLRTTCGTCTHLGLLSLYARILDELIRRAVVRTRNAPAGDLAEHLVRLAYDGVLAPNSEKSWDVKAADGRLLQVKCRVVGQGSQAQMFSPFRSWDFDACVFVVLDASTYEVRSAWDIPRGPIKEASYRSEWVRGDRMSLSGVRRIGEGFEVTDRLAAMLDQL